MGQAWCKEKTSQAQDSKSPLDRVFVRCAHRIYPSLKEEGSVLGGATQRVTSSEIGYAGSPPREVLTRGRSIDSVDRPFHPSDWVDVNLEVPSTPRPSPVLTNLTIDTSLHPTSNPTSNDSKQKNATPVPPPRRRKKNKGRPLPPKPDETAETTSGNLKRSETGDEPLYSSVRSPKSGEDEQDIEEEAKLDKRRSTHEDVARDGRRTKEIYEHKVNGTGRIITSDVVSGKRSSHQSEEKSNHHRRRSRENEEYERFASGRTSKNSSTPNREDKRTIEKQIKESTGDANKLTVNARSKNYSTVSLPNYDELDVARHRTKETEENDEDKTKPRRPVRSSTGSLPAESFLSPFSEKTSVRLEDYIPRRGSPDNLSPYQLLEKLDCGEGSDFVKYEDASKSPDWDLGDIGNCELNHQQRRSPFEPISGTGDKERSHENSDKDVVDFSANRESGRRSPVDQDVSTSSIYLQKPDLVVEGSSPALGELEYSEVDPNSTRERHLNPVTFADSRKGSASSTASKEPFFLDEEKHRNALDAIGSSCGDGEQDRSSESRTIFARTLSNESEPNEYACETKELRDRATDLIRTISEESLPKEMLEEQRLDELFDEKLAKDAHNKLKKSLEDWKTKTPPPSPEPKIKSEVHDSDHSALLKVLKDETAGESNLSSMTPSLTELEAALSDMLEKEETQDGPKEEKNTSEGPVSLGQILKDKKPSTGRKVSFCSWEESLAQSEIMNDREFTERSVDLDKRTVSHSNEDVAADLPPEKPSRLNRSLDEIENAEVPTPPKRRNRSLQVAKSEGSIDQNGSVYANDRLI